MIRPRRSPALAFVAAAALVSMLTALALSGPADARLSCRSGGSKVIKRSGSGIIFYTFDRSSNVGTYRACSTLYGKRVVIARDASRAVDEPFLRKSTTVSGSRAEIVYCVTTDQDGQSRSTAVANLRTGKVRTTSVAVPNNAGC